MIKNILAIRNDRFGEFLLIIPALAALKESFPGAKITLTVNSYVRELAGCVESADEVIVWENKRHSLREVFKFSAKLKKRKFDLAVIFNPSKEAHLISFLAGVPKRVGYDRKWGILLTHKLKDTKYLGNRHEVDCNLELVGLVGARGQSPAGTVPDFHIKVDDNLTSVVHEDRGQSAMEVFRFAQDESPEINSRRFRTVPSVALRLPHNDKYDFLAGAIAVHPFTSDPVKQWPVERFRELAQRITREMKAKVVLVGKEDQKQQGTPCEAECPLIVDLTNKTSLVELAQVLKQCRLLISCDSGPMHLSAAVGIPVVALFRNDLPGKTAKRWGPWGAGHTVIEKSRLEDISVDEVFEKVKQGLPACR
ncbi:MAG: hypothetical protein COT38_01205 [Candidatus Omnitrophica bacterium CG08_land_8_20_14_0_20_41_16]|uniref:Glycosyl transferase n=1 Tax=Candidatus Sherwoodlollariibacterium unditelluris TaxID=1974757 RepID=A0A2G9YI91_9BACT|nr:MAG: hypothetical protein COX41_05410 [Candidatus Omnitrophica bacterium CG23_combo_of_CG06-09_8_20_14_all_41_10]PIS34230.1 MAG: hypothetical protein COT38_01205 [Candidatus Omnitrophica bacterium CG08_land_8_20_14_0_20_41_16]